MRLPFRVISIAVSVLAVLAIPAIASGAPATPVASTTDGPIGQARRAPAVYNGPTLISGAQVRSVGVPEVLMAAADDSSLRVGALPDGEEVPLWAFNVNHKEVAVPLDVPGGSTLLQIDVYGYTWDNVTQPWTLYGNDVATGTRLDYLAWTTSGTGLIHTSMPVNAGAGWTVSAGIDWQISLTSTSDRSGFVGVTYQYRPPTLSYFPIVPIRAFDSRFSTSLKGGSYRTIGVQDGIDQVTGAVATPDAVPSGARAISFTVTITGTVGAGWVAVLPGTTNTTNVSTINWWTKGQTFASGGIVGVGSGAADRKVTLLIGGKPTASTHVILDVTGYYM